MEWQSQRRRRVLHLQKVALGSDSQLDTCFWWLPAGKQPLSAAELRHCRRVSSQKNSCQATIRAGADVTVSEQIENWICSRFEALMCSAKTPLQNRAGDLRSTCTIQFMEDPHSKRYMVIKVMEGAKVQQLLELLERRNLAEYNDTEDVLTYVKKPKNVKFFAWNVPSFMRAIQQTYLGQADEPEQYTWLPKFCNRLAVVKLFFRIGCRTGWTLWSNSLLNRQASRCLVCSCR